MTQSKQTQDTKSNLKEELNEEFDSKHDTDDLQNPQKLYGQLMTNGTEHENNKELMKLYSKNYRKRIDQFNALLIHYTNQSDGVAELRKIINTMFNEHMHFVIFNINS
jgi:hypothetical protein